MKRINFKKILLTLMLCLVLTVSSPLSVFASEAQGAQEASSAGEAGTANEVGSAPGAAPAPEAETSASPSPSTETSTSNVDGQESSSSEYDHDWDDDEVDEDDLNLDGDEWVSSGSNSSGNVGDTSITTGDASANGQVVTSANNTTVSGPSACSVCVDEVNVNNSGNGAGSNNSAGVDVSSDSTVSIDNNADVDNNLNLLANSGNNVASYNVGDSEIETGDANISGVVITSANETGLGIVEYNIIDDHMGDIILAVPDGLFGCGSCDAGSDISAGNTGNGTDSTNSIEIDSDNTTNTTVNNDADVVNNLDLSANTGYNQTSYNTGGDSSITTGDANVAANLLNFVNSTIVGGVAFVVNVFGDLVGDIIFPDSLPGIGGTSLSATNSGNGADSTNTIDMDSANENNTTLNNFADIDNILNIDATTGGNSTNYNTGGDSSIETGDVFVNAEVLNIVNTNLLGDSSEPLWLILVNNMGSWTGRIIGALSGTNYSGSDGFVFTIGDGGEVIAANSGNGAGSTNDIGISQNNTNNLDINNTANVTNNVNIKANTGGNSASYNTGGDSSIETGDVNVAASIMNFINTNIIGRTIMLGIVNVFGSWTGNAVPPGEEKDNVSSSSGGTGGSDGSGGGNSSSNTGSASSNVSVGGFNLSNLLGSESNSTSTTTTNHNSSLFSGSGGSGGTIDGKGSAATVDSNVGQILGDSAQAKDGILSLTFNWKILLASLIPLLAFGFYRARVQLAASRSETAVAHEIKPPKKK